MYYESRFGKCKNDIRKTWELINDILSKTKWQPSQTRFKEGENIIYDKAEITHTCNNCFTNIEPNLANQINININKSHPFYMNSNTLITFEFTDVDEHTVIDVLR